MIRKTAIVSLVLFLLSSLILCQSAYKALHKPFRLSKPEVFVIAPKTALAVIAKNLSDRGIVEHPKLFLLWIYANGLRHQIKAGEYAISPAMNTMRLIETFCAGKVIQHALTIVPGWTFAQLRAAINQHPQLSHTTKDLSDQALMAALGHPRVHPEARFFPDTYHFPLDTSDRAFLKRAYDRMERTVQTLWEKRPVDYPLASAEAALILASIVEKESAFEQEYTEIAGVYLRRLARNMPLQADPTVLYGLGPTWKGPLTRKGLQQASPYNTYQNKGLPPTPIAIPSQGALEATFYPKEGNSLYFVLRPDRQGHAFSKNLSEHVEAVKRYRQAQSKS